MIAENMRKEKAKNLRYKRPIATDMNLSSIREALWEMEETCGDIEWFESDEENLIAAMDGDEDEAYEFKMAFIDLATELERFQSDLEEEYVADCFDDLLPAMNATYFDGFLGFDTYEGDYFGISPFEYKHAQKEAEKRVCRLTKKELLEACGQCLKVVVQFLAVKYRYDCLEASFRILKDEHMQILKLFKAIEEQYEKANEESHGFKFEYCAEVYELDKMLDRVPQEYWIQ